MVPDPHAEVEQVKARRAERWRLAQVRALLADGPRRHRVFVAFTLIALVLIICLSVLARLYTVLPLDIWVTRELQEHEWALVSRVMYAVSFLGYEPWSVFAVALGCVFASVVAGWRDAVYLPLITISQGLTNVAIKTAIGRPRPLDTAVDIFVPEHGFSFPSGHVMFYTVFFGYLIFLALSRLTRPALRWLFAAPCAALVLLVGPSRIILGSHWLSDVLAAYLIGLLILFSAIEARLWWAGRNRGTRELRTES